MRRLLFKYVFAPLDENVYDIGVEEDPPRDALKRVLFTIKAVLLSALVEHIPLPHYAPSLFVDHALGDRQFTHSWPRLPIGGQ
jgi:hypothetical protein